MCAKDRRGRFKLKRVTSKQKLRAKLQEVKLELQRRRHLPIPEQGRWLASDPSTQQAQNRALKAARQRTARLASLIRIDAPLEPGDSGGPLLNAAGRVIGMDTAASVGFEFQSAREGYAIPINRVLAVAKQIEARRGSTTVHVGSTPFLGISVSPSSRYGGTTGALVLDVAPGSPADRAGIVAGDTITTLNGHPIASYDALTTALLRRNAGATVALGWIDQTGASHSARVRTVAGPPQ